MIIRYAALLLLTGAAGLLSGLLWLMPNGLMAAALGMSLSVGTIYLGIKQAAQKGELTVKQALVGGFGSGLLGGILMAVISELCVGVKRHEFGPPILPFWVPLVAGPAYGIVIHWSYYRRRFLNGSLSRTLARTCGLCFLLKALPTFVYIAATEKGDIPGPLLGSTMLSLLGAVPFAFFWVLITSRLDPEWSRPDWERVPSP